MARAGGAPLPTITDDRVLGAVDIQRSLRFNRGDAPYLQATLGNGDEDKWTWSGWVKKTVNGQHQNLFSSGSDVVYTHINFDNSDRIRFQNWHSAQKGTKITTKFLRDNSAWMHIVVIWDSGNSTADDRMRIYVNGTRETSFSSSTNPDQNQDSVINGNSLGGSDYGEGKHFIGKFADTSDNSGTYKTEIHFIDGYAYDPSYFGFTDSQTGIWMPKRYEGVYGSNGFYLDFSDNSSTTTLGIDKSPNGNDFTLNNFSVSAGTGNDSLIDTPSNNFCTLNAVNQDSNTTLTEGNLKAAGSSSTAYSNHTHGTIAKSSGKWYYEVEYTANAGGHNSNLPAIGWARTTLRPSDNPTVSGGLCYRPANADYIDLAGNDTSDDKPQTSTGNVIQVAIDLDAGKIWFGNGGTYFESGNPSTGANATLTFTGGAEELTPFVRSLSSTFNFNFGQRAFSYTPPTGFNKLSSSDSIPTPPSVVRPQKHFDTLLYTGNGSTLTVSGLKFQPDFVWIKVRSHSGDNHHLYDSVRGAAKTIFANTDDDEQTSDTDRLSSFTSNGFTLGNNYRVNGDGRTFVAWCWKAGGAAVSNSDGAITSSVSVNREAGFSIVSYSGNGNSTATIGHGLGKAPKWIMTKCRTSDSQADWVLWHEGLSDNKNVFLNQTNAEVTPSYGHITDPTSTLINVTKSSGNQTNVSGQTYISYCWTDVPGYSKFGTYTGNNTSDGPYIHLGFRPAWIMMKSISTGGSATYSWPIFDSKRSSYNIERAMLRANTNDAELDANTADVDILSNGFKPRYSPNETNGPNSYVYFAFAEQSGTTPFDTFPNAR